jgi:predicted dehydrogenase
MRFAVIGCQHSHIKMFIDEMIELGHEFIGIHDNSDFFLPKQYCDEYKVKRLKTLDDVLNSGIDIVGNADRNDKKIDIIEWCEEHNIPIMTDKPIVSNYENLKRLKAVIDRKKIKLGMMLTERFSPALQTLKKLIDDDVIGELIDFTFLKPHKLNKNFRPDWFFDKNINGGLIIDILIHDVDLMRWYTGAEVIESDAMLVKSILPEHPGFFDSATASILMDNGITASMKADWHMPLASNSWGDGRIFVTGTKARVEVCSTGDIRTGNSKPLLLLTTHESKTEAIPVVEIKQTLSESFINYVNGSSLPLITVEDIYASNKTVLNIDEKAKQAVRIL